MQANGMAVIVDLLTVTIRGACEAPHMLPHGQMAFLNKVNRIRPRYGQQMLVPYDYEQTDSGKGL